MCRISSRSCNGIFGGDITGIVVRFEIGVILGITPGVLVDVLDGICVG